MLVLTRKLGEKIRIGDEIEVRVLSVSGSRVRLGVDAPGNIEIVRNELRRRREEWQPSKEAPGTNNESNSALVDQSETCPSESFVG